MERTFRKATVLFCPRCILVRTFITFQLCPRCGGHAIPGHLVSPETSEALNADPVVQMASHWKKWQAPRPPDADAAA